MLRLTNVNWRLTCCWVFFELFLCHSFDGLSDAGVGLVENVLAHINQSHFVASLGTNLIRQSNDIKYNVRRARKYMQKTPALRLAKTMTVSATFSQGYVFTHVRRALKTTT